MLEFDTFSFNNFDICNYNSIDLSEVREYINSLDSSWFFTIKLLEGEKIESVMIKYYGSTDHTDLILFLNKIDAIFDMPFNFDIVDTFLDTDMENYSLQAFGTIYTKFNFKDLKSSLSKKYEDANLKARYIKLPAITKLPTIASKISQILQNQREMYNLLDLELL